MNGNNLNIVRHETRTFRNNRREYLKDKINELEKTLRRTKRGQRDLCRGINELRRVTNLDINW
jgi:uncharacterized protein YydD (DUF2326 family)